MKLVRHQIREQVMVGNWICQDKGLLVAAFTQIFSAMALEYSLVVGKASRRCMVFIGIHNCFAIC